MEWLLVGIGLLVLAVSFQLQKRSRKMSGRVWQTFCVSVAGLLIVLAVALLVAGGGLFWYTHRPLPSNTYETLFEGITYTRDVRHVPRPLVIHVVTVDLSAPGIGFLVTPGKPTGSRKLPARTTSQFLTEFNLQVAINGDSFTPWRSNSPWDYYPHVGDPVDVVGFASSKGTIYSRGESDTPTFYISENNQVQFNTPVGKVYNALSGNCIFLEQSIVQPHCTSNMADTPQPRTAIALDRKNRSMIIIVVDGRQSNYSEGVTLAELAEIVAGYGGGTALNLDGGGSTTLIARGRSGKPIQLNSPIDNRIPGRERPVANHLGIYARRP
jgi:hypothetical protein